MQQTHSVNVKIVIFSVHGGTLVLYAPLYVLPGRNLSEHHLLEEEIKKILSEKGFVYSDSFIEQLYTINAVVPEKTISVVYFMLLEESLIPDFLQNSWVAPQQIPESSVDYQSITYALRRLQWKIEYTNIVYSLLPTEFTLSQLQNVYEAILGKVLDKRNFRKKILSLSMLRATGEKKLIGRARPAELYTFIQKQLAFIEIV